MIEQLVRAGFSLVAAAVLLAMSSEWAVWALEQRAYWKLAAAVVLAGFAVFEAHQVWVRVDALIAQLP